MEKSPKIYTISLNSSLDRTYYLENILFGDINRVKEVRIDPGGKGINVARMVKILGGDTVALSFFGGQNGRLIRNLLRKEGVKFRWIETKDETRNIFNFIGEKDKKILRINEKGPKISKDEEASFYSLLDRIGFKKNDIVAISGSLPQNLKVNTYRRIIEKLKSKTEFIALDADGNLLREGIKASPFLIKPNLWELERAVGENINSWDKFKRVCENIIKKGVSVILLTLGEKGAVLFSSDKILYGKPPKVKLESDVGCGDAFLAGFLFKFAEKEKVEECLKFAIACGAGKASEKGTKMPDKSKVLKLVGKVRILKNTKRLQNLLF